MKNGEPTIAALDIGSTKVVVIVGQIQEGMIQIIGVGRSQNTGLRRGTVVDIEETVSSISGALEDAQRTSGIEIDGCFTGMSGSQITSVDSKGVIAASRADGEIQEDDVERAIESANSVALPANFDILHSVPKSFTVDGQNEIKDPVGLAGIRLEVTSHVIGASASAVRNLGKAVQQSGLNIDGIIFSPLASAKAFLTKKQKEIGVAIVDIGASSTSLAVYEEGTLLHTKVIPLGANHITNDIAIGLKISIDAAEKLKVSEVDCEIENVREAEKIDLSKYERGEKEKPTRLYVCEIAQARLNEIFDLVKEELKTIERDEMLPAGAILVGGGAKIKGLQPLAKKALGLPVQVGHPVFEVSGIVDKMDDPEYATAVGLLLWGLDESHTNVSNRTKANLDFKKVSGAIDRIKEIFRNLVP